MRFERFDREMADPAVRVQLGRLVRVDEQGRLVFSAQACEVLAVRAGLDEVTLLFDVAARMAAVRPAAAGDGEGSRWRTAAMRSTEWPMSVAAAAFVSHYRIRVAAYSAAELDIRVLVFAVGSMAVAAPGRAARPGRR